MEIHVEKKEGENRNAAPEADIREEAPPAECCCNGTCGGSRCAGRCGSACGSKAYRCRGGWLRLLAVLFGVFLIALIIGKAVEIRRAMKFPPAGVSERTLTLSASGKSTVVPDTAEVQLSVLTEAATPEDAQKQNTTKMNEVIDFVKTLDIAAKDVKTASYALYPKYEYNRGKSTIVGYTLTQTLRVVVRDSAKIGTVLEGATARGVNQVGDVRFFVDDPEKFRDEARREAFLKAEEKVRSLARLAGVRLGDLVSFSESGGETPPPIVYGRGGGMANAATPPQVEPGTEDITVTVRVTYAIR